MLLASLVTPVRDVFLPVTTAFSCCAKECSINDRKGRNESESTCQWRSSGSAIWRTTRARDRKTGAALVLPTRLQGESSISRGSRPIQRGDRRSLGKVRKTHTFLMDSEHVLNLENVRGPSSNKWHHLLTVTLRDCPRLVRMSLALLELIKGVALTPFGVPHQHG